MGRIHGRQRELVIVDGSEFNFSLLSTQNITVNNLFNRKKSL